MGPVCESIDSVRQMSRVWLRVMIVAATLTVALVSVAKREQMVEMNTEMITIVMEAQTVDEASTMIEVLHLKTLAKSLGSLKGWPVQIVVKSLQDLQPGDIVLYHSYQKPFNSFKEWELKFGKKELGRHVMLINCLEQYSATTAEEFQLMGCLTTQGMYHWRGYGRNDNVAMGLLGRREVLQQIGINYEIAAYASTDNYALVADARGMRLPELLAHYIAKYTEIYPIFR